MWCLGVVSLAAAVAENPIDKEIKKIAEEAVTKTIETVMPNTIQIAGVHNFSHHTAVPVIGQVSIDLALSRTNMTGFDQAVNTTFSTFTETGVNVTVVFASTHIVANAEGEVCAGKCDAKVLPIAIDVPLTLEAEVTYTLRKLGPVPIGLDGDPCFGPVLASKLGTASVSGLGRLDKYLTEAVNAAIREQHFLETPLDDAVNLALAKIESHCNITAAQPRGFAAGADGKCPCHWPTQCMQLNDQSCGHKVSKEGKPCGLFTSGCTCAAGTQDCGPFLVV